MPSSVHWVPKGGGSASDGRQSDAGSMSPGRPAPREATRALLGPCTGDLAFREHGIGRHRPLGDEPRHIPRRRDQPAAEAETAAPTCHGTRHLDDAIQRRNAPKATALRITSSVRGDRGQLGRLCAKPLRISDQEVGDHGEVAIGVVLTRRARERRVDANNPRAAVTRSTIGSTMMRRRSRASGTRRTWVLSCNDADLRRGCHQRLPPRLRVRVAC
jgi:hypothetical protein